MKGAVGYVRIPALLAGSLVLGFCLCTCSSFLDSGDTASSRAAGVELRYGTTAVVSGGSLNVGSALIGTHKDLAFAIRNKGSKYLMLSGSPAVAFDGEGASQFVLKTADFPAILPVGGYLPFKVRFTPASLGTKHVTLRIECNDGSNSAFRVTVSCTADPIAVTGMALSETAHSLAVGTTFCLFCTVTPANATYSSVTWSSSNPAAASVSEEGLVTGISEGDSVITATTEDGSRSASCAVLVYIPAVSGVTLSPSNLALTAGESGQLTASVTPGAAKNKKVSWTSSDPSRAAVSASGLVTAIAGGSATITATTEDGGYAAACPVNVYTPTSWVNVAASSSSPFTARRYHQSLAYNGKLYVIAGNRSDDTILNDVWSSSDGINWTNILPHTASPGATQFPQRRSHRCIVFKEKIWVIGGEFWSGTEIPKNDVWSSADGVTWTQVLADTATPGPSQFERRCRFSMLTDGDAMYILGGAGATRLDDVWSSTDGATWTQVRADGAAGGFVARIDHSSFNLNGTFYVLAGSDTVGALADVWSSSDKGATWTKLTDSAFPPRAYHAFASYGGKFWVASGFHDSYVVMNDLWSSSDGVAWTEVLPDGNSVFPGRFSSTMTAFDNKLYIIAGGTGSGPMTAMNDVWQVQ